MDPALPEQSFSSPVPDDPFLPVPNLLLLLLLLLPFRAQSREPAWHLPSLVHVLPEAHQVPADALQHWLPDGMQVLPQETLPMPQPEMFPVQVFPIGQQPPALQVYERSQ